MKSLLTIIVLLIAGVTANSQDLEGEKLVEAGRINAAEKHYQMLLEEDPEDSRWHYYSGELNLLSGRNKEALESFNKAAGLDRKSALAKVGLARLAFDQDPAKGKKLIDEARDIERKDFYVVREIAQTLVDAGKHLDLAKELLLNIERKQDDNVWYYITLGDVYLEAGDGSKAVEMYEKKALNLEPGNPAALNKIGVVYARANNYDLALDYFEKAAEADQQFAPAYREIAELYFKAGKYGKAVENYEKYMDIAGRTVENEYRYASFLFLNKNYTEAISLLEKLLKEDAEVSGIANRLLAYSYYETDEFDKGLTYINKFFETTGEDEYLASDYAYRGKLLYKTGDTIEGTEDLEKALELDPENEELYNEVGKIYFENDQLDKAAETYSQKLRKAGGSVNDILNLGKIYYVQGMYETADSVFVVLEEKIPQLPYAYRWRAKVNARLDPDKKEGLAVPHYEKLLEIAENNLEKYEGDYIEANAYLGDYYSIQGDYDLSEKHWKNVLEVDPDNKYAKQALQN